MSDPIAVERVFALLRERYGKAARIGRSRRLWNFMDRLSCSVNYSKVLRGDKFFFGLSQEVLDENVVYPETQAGDFVLLICGSESRVLVLPRSIVLEVLRGVPTRKLDVFMEGDSFTLQTTRHPKLNVTEFLNAFPSTSAKGLQDAEEPVEPGGNERTHVRVQSALVDLGVAEGCSVWVPPSDRSLSFEGQALGPRTLQRLPNFGFDETTRRIVQNIDVLWLTRNIIRKAFEIEVSTVIYSGLLRLNDLVLSQPNNQIQLYLVASSSKRQKVFNQLVRPSFQSLIERCEFFPCEEVDVQWRRISSLRGERGVKVSGLVRGERFSLPENVIYPTDL